MRLQTFLQQYRLEGNLESAWQLKRVGLRLRDDGDALNAAAFFRAASELLTTLGDPEPQLRLDVDHEWAAMLVQEGDLGMAEVVCRDVLTRVERMHPPNHPDVLLARNQLGWVLLDRGSLDEAINTFRDALAATGGASEMLPVRVALLNGLAQSLLAANDLDGALQLQRKVLGHWSALPDNDERVLRAKNNLAEVFCAMRRYDSAERYSRAVVRAREGQPVSESGLIAASNLAKILHARGNLIEAESLERSALKSSEELATFLHPTTLMIAHNLAETLRGQGRYRESAQLYRRVALARESVLGSDHPETIVSMQNLALAQRAQGHLAAAVRTLREILRRADRARARATSLEDRSFVSGHIRVEHTAVVLATALLQRGHVGVSSAITALQRGTSSTVLDSLRRASVSPLSVSRNQFPKDLSSTRREYKRSTTRLQLVRGELTRLRKQLLRTIRFDSTSLDPSTDPNNSTVVLTRRMRSLALLAGTLEESLIRGERQLFPLARPANLRRLQTSLMATEAILQLGWSPVSIVAMVIRHRHDPRTTGQILTKSHMDIRRLDNLLFLLRVGIAAEATLSDVIDQRLHLALAKLRKEPFKPARLRDAIDACAKALHQRWRAGGRVEIEAVHLQVLAREVTRVLLPDSVLGALEGATTVFLVPSGPLHEVPLSLLDDLSGGTAFGSLESMILPAPGFIRRPARRKPVKKWSVTLVGDPAQHGALPAVAPGTNIEDRVHFDNEVLEGQWTPLPYARAEVSEVAKLLKSTGAFRVHLLLGTEASPSRVRRIAKGSRIFHLATHGELGQGHRPGETGLLLARAPWPAEDCRGRLHVSNLLMKWRGQLVGCELVTLSACHSAASASPHDAMFALPLGFLSAGADTVVASTWRADDFATCLLMRFFYTRLLTAAREDLAAAFGGRQASRALKGAQEDLRQFRIADFDPKLLSPEEIPTGLLECGRSNTECPFAHPRYWGGFVVIANALVYR